MAVYSFVVFSHADLSFYAKYIDLRSFYARVADIATVTSVVAVPSLPPNPPAFVAPAQPKRKIKKKAPVPKASVGPSIDTSVFTAPPPVLPPAPAPVPVPAPAPAPAPVPVPVPQPKLSTMWESFDNVVVPPTPPPAAPQETMEGGIKIEVFSTFTFTNTHTHNKTRLTS